jgi:hypothetical protein
VADAMRAACAELLSTQQALPSARPLPVGKLVALLCARQGNAPFFRELSQMLGAMLASLAVPELGRLNSSVRG